MSKSMTAYARVSSLSPLGTFVLELHSVNRKTLDLSLYLPKEFLRFDIDLRKWLSSQLERGQVTLKLHFSVEGLTTPSSSLYRDQLKKLKTEWESVCKELGLDTSSVDLLFLVSRIQPSMGLDSKEEERALRAVLQESTERALVDLMQMKQVEGAVLAKDIEERLHSIEENLILVESRKEVPLASYRKKITERLREVSPLTAELEERIAREVALLAEKMDVTEEIVRLRAHIAQVRHHLLPSTRSVGKTLDFLAQEMNREMNTLGSKSQDSEISSLVIHMKSELDRIREQVQNIE